MEHGDLGLVDEDRAVMEYEDVQMRNNYERTHASTWAGSSHLGPRLSQLVDGALCPVESGR